MGRAKLRSRMRNVSSPPPPEDTGEASVASEEDFPVEREEAPPGIAAADPAFWIPTGVPPRPHSSDVVGTGGSEGLYGLAADMARARVDAGAFGLATFAESTGPLFGASFSEQNGSWGDPTRVRVRRVGRVRRRDPRRRRSIRGRRTMTASATLWSPRGGSAALEADRGTVTIVYLRKS